MSKALVEYFNNSQIRFGLKEESKTKKGIAITDITSSKKISLMENKILSIHPFFFSSHAEAKNFLKEFENKISQEVESIEAALLWEILAESLENFDWLEAAELYYGTSELSPQQISAIKRVLHGNSTYFKRKGSSFIVKSSESVEQELVRQKQTLLNQEKRINLKSQLDLLGRFKSDPSAPEVQEILSKLESCLWKQENDPQFNYYKTLVEESHSSFQKFCFAVLTHYGKLPNNLEPELAIRGLSEEFTSQIIEEAFQFSQREPKGIPLPEDGICFSIDDEDTQEKDDALFLKKLDADHFLVGILISNVSFFIPKESLVDKEAQKKGTTYYLPDRVVPMLPESLSFQECSLEPSQKRSALGGWFKVSRGGEILDFFIEENLIEVQVALTYETFDQGLNASFNTQLAPFVELIQKSKKSPSELKEYFEFALQFAKELQQQRAFQGALQLNRKEYVVKVKGEEILLKSIKFHSPSYLLISEFMILINSYLAEYAKNQDIPMIYRCQDKSSFPFELPESLEEHNPATLEKIFRQLKPSRLSTKPESHSGLGVSCYAQVSSPIRRYIDLVLQRQLLHYFQHQEVLYEEKELLELFSTAEILSKQAKDIENTCKTRWLKRWLKTLPPETAIQSYVLEANGTQQRIELNNCGLIAQLQNSESLTPGEKITVILGKISESENRTLRAHLVKENSELPMPSALEH